ncbi:MAG: DUF1501 domain-containing protein, partial [Planctomycetota bacterium]
MNPLSMMQEITHRSLQLTTRRHFLRDCQLGLAGMWLGSQSDANASESSGASESSATTETTGAAMARAKRVIFLHMAGAPSQLELFDYKPD